MPLRAVTSFLLHIIRWLNEAQHACQCPLGLLLHFYKVMRGLHLILNAISVNALSSWYFISTVPLQKPRFYAFSRACFCRYLSECSGNSLFLCMFIIWTYFSRFFCFFHCFDYSIKPLLCHQFLLNFPCKFALPPETLIEPPGTLIKPAYPLKKPFVTDPSGFPSFLRET